MSTAVVPVFTPRPRLRYCATRRKQTDGWYAIFVGGRWLICASERQVNQYAETHGFSWAVRDDSLHPMYPRTDLPVCPIREETDDEF